jgi:RimJ/RimL family protein N-acetyltransferase
MMPGVLETERLRLRLPEARDLDGLAPVYTDPEVVRFTTGFTRPLSDVPGRIAAMRSHWERFGVGLFALERKEDGQVLGRVGFLVWDADFAGHGLDGEVSGERETELGWTLARGHWGHGYATEAALAARDWALEEVRPPRFVSLIHPENVRSQRVAEKLGERHERNVVAGGHDAQLWVLG